MKKALSLSFLICSLFLLTSCVKENHSVRFRNDFGKTIDNIEAGAARLGTVKPGQTSDYKPITTGEFKISGTTDSGYIEGSGVVTGKGTHKWTITISSAGKLSMGEDK